MSEQAPDAVVRQAVGHQVSEALHKAAEQQLAEVLNRQLKNRITAALDDRSAQLDGFRTDFDAALTRLVSAEKTQDALDTALRTVTNGPELAFKDVSAFVCGYVAQVYARDMRDRNWCPRWFDHPGAVVVLNALWLAFESYRRQPGTGPATFLTDKFLPLMNWLSSDRGPLTGCSPTLGHANGKIPAPLPCEAPPNGLYSLTPADLKRMPGKPRPSIADLASTSKDNRR